MKNIFISPDGCIEEWERTSVGWKIYGHNYCFCISSWDKKVTPEYFGRELLDSAQVGG